VSEAEKMDALLSPKFRTKTQKFYYQNNPDSGGGVGDFIDGGKSPVSGRKASPSSADSVSPNRSASASASSRGKPSYFTFEHDPTDK
jgi:hypothetical protein